MTARTHNLNIRLTDDEAADMRAAAESAGMTLSDWARHVLRHASGRRELEQQLARVKGSKRRG